MQVAKNERQVEIKVKIDRSDSVVKIDFRLMYPESVVHDAQIVCVVCEEFFKDGWLMFFCSLTRMGFSWYRFSTVAPFKPKKVLIKYFTS